MISNVGVVVIGRNEGERLKNCLVSVLKQAVHVVYVDSGSSDGSVEYAREQGIAVVELDMSRPFSAARARNEGFFHLANEHRGLDYVQFIDGDCELLEGWIARGKDFLEKNPSFVIAAGRRVEKYPEASIYNQLCNLEWNTPVGPDIDCGGDFLVRYQSFMAVKGFNPNVVAGEEPDLCYRLRKQGGEIMRIEFDMTLHDAAMTRFMEWWRRAKRTGHAYAQGYFNHRKDRQGYYFKESIKDWGWGLVVPLAAFIPGVFLSPFFLLILLIYPIRLVRIIMKKNREIHDFKLSRLYGLFILIANFPQLTGHLLFLRRKLFGNEIRIIEPKKIINI